MDRIIVVLLFLSHIAVNGIDVEKADEFGSKSTSTSTTMAAAPATALSFGSPIYQASVQNSSNHHICNAVILKRDWILTLAQCVSTYTATELNVFYGSNRLNDGGMYVAVKRIYIHPSFDRSIVKGDLALLFTESIKFIANVSGSINLPRENVPVNHLLAMSGWPVSISKYDKFNCMCNLKWIRFQLKSRNGSVVQHRSEKTISTQECRKLNPALNHIIRTWLICSIDPINRANICANDLGSVLVTDDNTLYGIRTMNEETCANAIVNIYTNVFTQVTWINAIIYEWPWP